ncbi:MAG: hypothetical protein FK731_02445 [Asgard group archaeon]|nr:hypothetical protein [Asgard group archaeon]
MVPRKRLYSINLVVAVLLLTSMIGLNNAYKNTTNSISTSQDNQTFGNILELTPNEGSYFADINWINTTIDLDQKGSGLVEMIINCTPSEDHFGIYIRPLVTGEVEEVIPGETYAINDGQTLSLNYTFVDDIELSFRIYIEDIELLNISKSLQYHLSYKANFFTSKQIQHFKVDTDLVIIDFERPYWDGDLEFQNLEITLPIDIGKSNVTQDDLDGIKFSVAEYMNQFYNLTYRTKKINDEYLLVFNCRKESMLPLSPFEAQFFVSINHFSLPLAINWIVGLVVGIFVIGSVTILILVITIRKRTRTEIEEFEDGLYKIISTDES